MNSSLLSLGDQDSLFDEFTIEFTTPSDAAQDSTPHPLDSDIYNGTENAMHSFLLLDNPDRPEHPGESLQRMSGNNNKKSLDEASSLVSVVDANELITPLDGNGNVSSHLQTTTTERDQFNYFYNHHLYNDNYQQSQNLDIKSTAPNNNMPMPMSMSVNMSDGHPLQPQPLHSSSNDPQAIFFGQPEPLSEPIPTSTSMKDPNIHVTMTNSCSYMKKFEPVRVSMYSSTTPPPMDLEMPMFGGISSGPTMFHPPPSGSGIGIAAASSIPSTTISSSGLVGGTGNMMNMSSDDAVFPTGLETPACQICEKIFPDLVSLKSHRRKEHPKPKKYPCNISGCTVRFSAKCNLSKHVKSVHQKQRPHICTVAPCKRAFSERNKLIKHEETVHNGMRPYQCDWPDCSAEFGQKSDRTRHINVVHKGERRYQCRNCKSFGRKSSLAQHLLRVHGIRQSAVNALIQLAQEKLTPGEERLVVKATPRSGGSAA